MHDRRSGWLASTSPAGVDTRGKIREFKRILIIFPLSDLMGSIFRTRIIQTPVRD